MSTIDAYEGQGSAPINDELLAEVNALALDYSRALMQVDVLKIAPAAIPQEITQAIAACEDVARRARDLAAKIQGIRALAEVRAMGSRLN